MPQRIDVDSNNNVRVTEVGPIGPPGFAEASVIPSITLPGTQGSPETDQYSVTIENPTMATYYAKPQVEGTYLTQINIEWPADGSNASSFFIWASVKLEAEGYQLGMQDANGVGSGFLYVPAPPSEYVGLVVGLQFKCDPRPVGNEDDWGWNGFLVTDSGLFGSSDGEGDSVIAPGTLPALSSDTVTEEVVAFLTLFGIPEEVANEAASGAAGFLASLYITPDSTINALKNLDRVSALLLSNTVVGQIVSGEQAGRIETLEGITETLEGITETLNYAGLDIQERVETLEGVSVPSLTSSLASQDLIEIQLDQVNLIAQDSTGTWDDHSIRETGNLLYDPVTEQWIAAYSGKSLTAAPADVSVGLALSDDGITWEPHPDNPISGSEGGEDPYICKTILGEVYRDGDGKAYIYCEEKPGNMERGIALWKSAPNTLDGWTLHGRVLDRGDEGEWDDRDRSSPVVVFLGDSPSLTPKFVMLFEGRRATVFTNHHDDCIGVAYSSDGITWEASPYPIISPTHPTDSWLNESVVPDDLCLVGGVWVLTCHGSKPGVGYTMGRFGTADRPTDWDDRSFSEFRGNPFWTSSGDCQFAGMDPSKVVVSFTNGEIVTFYRGSIIKST